MGKASPSKGSLLSCTHADSCPLFPRLQASLEGWRRNYCDHATNWNTCARYERSLSGATVPITLLPNGRTIQLVEQPQTTTTVVEDRPADAEELPTRVSGGFFRRLFGGKK